jgi:hypothetical protein
LYSSISWRISPSRRKAIEDRHRRQIRHYQKRKQIMKIFTSDRSRKTGISTSNITKRVSISVSAGVAVAALVSLFNPSEAQAFSCGNNAFGAGCVGPRGAVAFNRNGAVAVGRYGNVYAYRRGSACYWRNNMRICP